LNLNFIVGLPGILFIFYFSFEKILIIIFVDYRSPNGAYTRGHKPVTFKEFTESELTKKRYWARSFVGWERFHGFKPNETHKSIAKLEQVTNLDRVITQVFFFSFFIFLKKRIF